MIEATVCVSRSRLLLLHHFAEMLCPVLPMFPLTTFNSQSERPDGDGGAGQRYAHLDALRGVLVASAKESAFRKVRPVTLRFQRENFMEFPSSFAFLTKKRTHLLSVE